MLKTKFKYVTILKNKKVLEKYSFNLITKINGIKCEMQLDTGSSFTFLTNIFIKKFELFKGKVNSYRNYDHSSLDGYCSHIKKVFINIEGLGKFYIPKCYIEVIITLKEQKRKLKEINESKLPFAGYLGCDFLTNKIFEINYKEEIIKIYSSLNELISLTHKIKFYPFSMHVNTFILPYTINNFSGNASFDTGSSKYTLLLENSIFKKFIKNNLNHLSYQEVIRPDFITRVYESNKKISFKVGNLIINNKTPIYSPSSSFSKYLFSNNIPHNAIIGNALFFDKRVIFDNINKRFAILES